MCRWGTETPILVKIPADLSHTGEAYWRTVGIDSCIADIVQALQTAGIDMRASCCGHGTPNGQIDLMDGRTLIVRKA